jgi:hypothetical protein
MACDPAVANIGEIQAPMRAEANSLPAREHDPPRIGE